MEFRGAGRLASHHQEDQFRYEIQGVGVYRLFALYAVTHVFPLDLSRVPTHHPGPSEGSIAIEAGAEIRTCEGETMVVNLQGTLIATTNGLSTGMRISIHVYLTDKHAAARVVYVDPENPLHCGIALDEPRTSGEFRCHPMTGMKKQPLRWAESQTSGFENEG
jgi:hypothetical protein